MAADDDRWLDRWLPLLRQQGTGAPVLELGCDTGGDTRWLRAHGFGVVATDISLDALRSCAAAAPGAHLVQQDLARPLPFRPCSFRVVVASLCLHYFDWRTTVAAVAQVHEVLDDDGLLLCRLNSTRDVLHGALQGEELEPHFFRQSARYADCKRFFDRADLGRLFDAAHWQALGCEELEVPRYALPKVAWELVLRKRGVNAPG